MADENTKTGDGNDPTNEGNGAAGTGDKKYTEADLNRILAQDRQRNERKAANRGKELEDKLAAILSGKELPEGSELRAQLDELQAGLMTAEDRAKKEAAKHAGELTAAKESATKWETKYRQSTIERALLDAALPKAVTPATAKIIARELMGSATLSDDGKVTIKRTVTDKGVTEDRDLSPEEAVAHMRSMVDDYGALFASEVNGGAGGKNAPKDGKGKIDWSNITMADMERLEKEGRLFDE